MLVEEVMKLELKDVGFGFQPQMHLTFLDHGKLLLVVHVEKNQQLL